MIKTELPKTKLSQNGKMKKTSQKWTEQLGHKVKILNWSIPAYESADGFRTCPLAWLCKDGCYAQANFYRMDSVQKSFEEKLKLTFREDFREIINNAIAKQKPTHVRIHDSGDFYSYDYLVKWIAIANDNPKIQFYAYTKSIPFIRKAREAGIMPINLRILFSMGGKLDSKIDKETEPHSIVIGENDAIPAGYIDASHDDLAVIANDKIALRFHGYKSKAFKAS